MTMTIMIRDKSNKWHKWIVYGETDSSLKVYADEDKKFITEIYKNLVYKIWEVYYSNEIRNPFDTLEKPNRCKAEFCEIWLEDN